MSSTRRQQALRRQVIREEPTCYLRYEGCTIVSDSVDHVIAVSVRPDLIDVRSNMRGACRHCNYKRGNNPPDTFPRRNLGAPAPSLSFFKPPKDVGTAHDSNTKTVAAQGDSFFGVTSGDLRSPPGPLRAASYGRNQAAPQQDSSCLGA